LYRIGERLARYDIEKKQALEEEDYERAKLKKYQIQEYRTETYKQLQANNLLGYVEVRLYMPFFIRHRIHRLKKENIQTNSPSHYYF
jgi:hypothetical protein